MPIGPAGVEDVAEGKGPTGGLASGAPDMMPVCCCPVALVPPAVVGQPGGSELPIAPAVLGGGVPSVLVSVGITGELLGGETVCVALTASGMSGCGAQRRIGISVVWLDGWLNGSVG